MSSASARAHEPSMEDILASIRRIIADDQVAVKPDATAGQDPRDEPAMADRPSEEVVDAPPPSAEAAPDIDRAAGPGRPDLDVVVPELVFSGPGREPDWRATPLPPRPRPAERRPEAPRIRESLISSEATSSIGDAFTMLSNTILSNNARTLEDLVRELLKPMLKAWLDDNLPPLVERLVRAEIERVARGR